MLSGSMVDTLVFFLFAEKNPANMNFTWTMRMEWPSFCRVSCLKISTFFLFFYRNVFASR